MVFVNTIKVANQLSAMLSLLHIHTKTLHAKLQQKQRMKSLESFKSSPKGVLIATDVAARGLDIPLVNNNLLYICII